MADIDIANAALARISEVQIVSFGDNTPVARAVSRIYPLVVNSMFSAMDWAFATARVFLTNPVAGVYPWAWQYAIPANVARARMVVQGANPSTGPVPPLLPYGQVNAGQQPFEEGFGYMQDGVTLVRVIRCDLPAASDPVLIYTALGADPSLWDAGFISALTIQLAAELAMPITGNGQLAREMQQAAQQAVASLMPVGQAQSITPMSRGPSTTTAARRAY